MIELPGHIGQPPPSCTTAAAMAAAMLVPEAGR